MKAYNGPHSPLVGPFEEQTRVRVRNLIPSLRKHANIGSEETEDEETEFTTVLPVSSLPEHQPPPGIHFADLYFPGAQDE